MRALRVESPLLAAPLNKGKGKGVEFARPFLWEVVPQIFNERHHRWWSMFD